MLSYKKNYMKFITLVVAGTITTTSFGATLTQKAIEAGLAPIPANKSAILKLVEDIKNPITDAKIELGKKLYFDPRLSKSSLISCNTCHNLGAGGADGLSTAIGHKWKANPHHLNSPTVYNSVFNAVQSWNGRNPDLEDQAQGPIQAGTVMAAPKGLVVQRITSIPAYVNEFKNAYGNNVKVDFKKIAETIGVFERTLITPSRFDEFLLGKDESLTQAEKEGLTTFIDMGCAKCHTGIGIGGTMQAFQITGKYKFSDVGDFKGDANGMVKTPILRNIEETAPYFHNGKVWSLKEAIKIMGSVQLGIKIEDKDATSIEMFLKSLTGEKPQIIYPILPPSTSSTIRPNPL
ncbi:MAG: Cytochrome c551 peroxidase [uncultured Sulfurimonas sp.]|nr:MAG: Cytochrome c551 peroxidase [uncultured Sulfurimonas sp.]